MAELTEEQTKEVVAASELINRSLDESMRADDDLDIEATAGTNDLQFETVKPRRVLIIEHFSAYNEISACTRIRLGYFNGHRINWLETQPAPLVTETVVLTGPLRLREGMYLIARLEGCTLHDDIHAALNGYWLKDFV